MDKHVLQALAEAKGYNSTKLPFEDVQRALDFEQICLWLRKEHNLYILVTPRYKVENGGYVFNYFIMNWDHINAPPFILSGFETYDECMYEAIRKAIDII